jgi:hypothetical protein
MKINTLYHPLFLRRSTDWSLWRDTYEGGEDFVDNYLKKYSTREDENDFKIRKALTPVPAFAKSAVKDIRNSIFQRLANVVRSGGSPAYQRACAGEGRGVDGRGSSMTGFIGKELLDELLVLGSVGVYIDAPVEASETVLGASTFSPYVYKYRVEQITNWTKNDPENPSEYQSVVLDESVEVSDEDYGLPSGSKKRKRHVWINELTGFVNVQFHYADEKEPRPVRELKLTKIPFVYLDLGESMIADVCRHQIALLNLWSSNVSYCSQAGFPIFTEQKDQHGVGGYLKKVQTSGTAEAGGQGSNDTEIKVGVARGRSYDMDAERPGFIHPSAEPLMASIDLCERLKKDIRELINLAVVNLGTQASAESKNLDNSGLEAGLSFIGLTLESGERAIAYHWASYESSIESQKNVAIVAYPQRWSLQSPAAIIADASALHDVVSKLPSREAKKVTAKLLVQALLGQKVGTDTMNKILAEIQNANFTTSSPEIIQMAKEQGMLSAETGAIALGFDGAEADKAAEEHVERLAAIAEHQTPPGGVQGVPDTQGDPAKDDKAAQAKNTDKQTEPRRQRGKGKMNE